MSKDKKEIATTENTSIGSVIDYADYADAGYENQSAKDLTVPYIGLLQSGSPQLESIPNAKPGMLYNSVSQEVFDSKTGIIFVPGITQHVFVEWIPRERGGGMVAVHEPTSPVVEAAQKTSASWNELKTPAGNDLIETFYMYGVVLSETEEVVTMAVLPFSSTKVKVYKKINTRLRTFTLPTADGRKIRPPIFAHKLRVSSVKDKSPKGDYYNFLIEPAVNGDVRESLLPTTHPAFLAAKECGDMVSNGLAKMDSSSHGARPDSEGNVPF